MNNNIVFNITVCIFGILILTIHSISIILKRGKRNDEKNLLVFLLFTIVHFATYLTFTLVKRVYTSDAYVIAFYTIFYIMNNVELFLMFKYMLSYVEMSAKTEKNLKLFNEVLFWVFSILDVVNVFTGIFFGAVDGEYQRSKTMIFAQGYQFVIFATVFIVTVWNKKLSLKEKIAFALYCVLPFGAIILQNVFKGYAIAYASIIIAIEVLFFFVNVQKNIDLAKEEEKNKGAQIKIMLSQIQPHFIYNALSSISTLITIDPEKAQIALDDFTEYLRHNLSSLTETKLIPFEDELKHVETYVSLEKVRFGGRVNVNYDIRTTGFFVPPLSVQPIVENAIKHGILKKLAGGTVIVKTYETGDNYVVEISDDGVGFEVDDVNFSNNKHFGINNVRYRIKNSGGDMKINSRTGKGTDVVVTFVKQV